METRSNFGSQKFGTTKIRNDNEDSYASINLPLTLSPPSRRADTLEGIVRLNAKGVIRLFLRHTSQMRTSCFLYHRHRFPVEIISH